MTLPFLEQNGVKFALFNNPDIEPYGAFTNNNTLGKYPIRQKASIGGKNKNYTWPTSAHAFQAQKIILLKNGLSPEHDAQKILSDMLVDIEKMQIESPFGYPEYQQLVTEKYQSQLSQALNMSENNFLEEFDARCGNSNDSAINDMRTVVRLKLAQHRKLAKIAIQCAKESILPVFVNDSGFWGTGNDGKGGNKLGIILLEESTKLLNSYSKAGEPFFYSPMGAYNVLKGEFNLAKPAVVHLLDPQNWGSEITRFKYSEDNDNHYFYDKELEITFVGHKDFSKCYYKKNDEEVVVDEIYHNFVIAEVERFLKAKNEPKYSFEEHKLKYKGSYNNGYKYHDVDTNISMHEKGKDVCFSQYGVEIDVDVLTNVLMSDKVSELKKEITDYYKHSRFENKSRFHFFKASVDKNDDISKKHHNLKGDALKTSLLMKYKSRLEECTSKEELDFEYNDIVSSSAYINVLAKGQGVATRLLHRKTSSVEALDKIKEALLNKLPEAQVSSDSYGFGSVDF